MTWELLYHIHFLVVLSEQRCVRVPEGVETEEFAAFTAGRPYRRQRVSGQSGCLPFMVGEANTQSVAIVRTNQAQLEQRLGQALSTGTSFAGVPYSERPGPSSQLNGEHGLRGSRSPHPRSDDSQDA
jgi:hypothetical protein